MSKEKRFQVAFRESSVFEEITIYVDQQTGVNYLYIVNGVGAGMTPLLDSNGQPVITQ